jgi:hypothetical protein
VEAADVQWYHWLMIAVFLAGAFISLQSRRALFWVAVLAADWLICEIYLAVPKPQTIGVVWNGEVFIGPWVAQSVFVSLVDAVVAAMILRRARALWEGFVFAVMLLTVILDGTQAWAVLFGYPPMLSPHQYGLYLDILNSVVILLIGGGALYEGSDYGRAALVPSTSLLGRLVGLYRRVGVVGRAVFLTPWHPSRRWAKRG